MSVRFALTGSLAAVSVGARSRLMDRRTGTDVAQAVTEIVDDVRERGDAALFALAERLDHVRPASLEVPRADWDAALDALAEPVRAALVDAARAIDAFHRAQLPAPLEVEVRPGVRLGRRAEPLRRVGVYAPGGRAAYPSSVLMGVVPAKAAGVAEVVVCSPPGSDARPAAAVLAACAIAGADRVFAVGGAGAIAALAYGTASVPRVDRIVGPGNAWVTEAKRQLTGVVAIDCPAGPSEVLIVADATADPVLIAAELVAQAEHDPDAAAVLVTTEAAHLPAVAEQVDELLEANPRRAIIETSLAARGALLHAGSLDAAFDVAADYAPEHLLLLIRDPRAALERVRAAGTVFLGPGSSVAFGDYTTGANHVLPTAGLARSYAGLNTLDFLRWTTWQEVSDEAAATLAEPTALLAEAEGLPGHATAARLRARARAAPAPVAVLPRAAFRQVRLYDPGRRPTALDLSDNTNLFGIRPGVAERLASIDPPRVTRYPSVYATDLKRAFATHLGVAAEHVTTGCGSDDIIDSALRAFCDPGDRVAYPVPTFGVVRTFARMNAAAPFEVPLGPEFALDASALLATGARVIYLCRPNNPTGTLFDRRAVERVVRDARGVVLIDEAYAEFAGEDLVELAVASDRAVVLRTLSKAWGLAGLRVGFAIGPTALIAEIEKSRGPYKVGGVAEALALATLSDTPGMREGVTQARENRARMERALRDGGFRVWPSAANFLLVQVPRERGSAGDLAAALRAAGVQVRPFPDLPQAGDCVRVTIGPWPMMRKFLDAMGVEAGR